MTGNGRPLVPYLRQSRAKERTISIEEQRLDIQRWASAAGVELAPEVIEQNVSGSKPWRDRALGEALEACARGDASGIIVAWQDRLSRENGRATAEVWEALEQAGARLVCAAEGLDTATGDHEMLFTIKAAIAREQWKRYRANFERARRSATERGVPSGRAALGYRRRIKSGEVLKPDPKPARSVVGAFELRARGVPYSKIGSRFGWSDSTTRQILSNDVYIGVVRHGGFVKENAHEALISRELFDAVQAARTIREPAPGTLTANRLLQGIARCAGCGRTLKVLHRTRADGRVASYYCKNAASEPCPDRAYVHCDELEKYVCERFSAALRSTPRLVDVIAVGNELEAAQRVLETRTTELTAFVENSEMFTNPEHFQLGYAARQGRVSEAQEQVRQLSARLPRLPAGGSLIDLWDRFDASERREVLAGFLGRVIVRRGASSDLENQVVIEWADGSVLEKEAGIGVAAA